MTKALEASACPVCGTELTIAQIFGHEDTQRAVARLAAISVPLGTRVMSYITLFAPPKTRLTLAKQLRLIHQLLPDLERAAIEHRGRTWQAPREAWAAAMDQMLEARALGKLDLPMRSHAYLYSIIAGMADKTEASGERQREADRRAAPRQDTVQVRGQDPALAHIEQASRTAAPVPAHARQLLADLKKGGGS